VGRVYGFSHWDLKQQAQDKNLAEGSNPSSAAILFLSP